MAEGAPLLRAYTLTRIEGSNPFLSARFPGAILVRCIYWKRSLSLVGLQHLCVTQCVTMLRPILDADFGISYSSELPGFSLVSPQLCQGWGRELESHHLLHFTS